jgi:hypothetical protein
VEERTSAGADQALCAEELPAVTGGPGAPSRLSMLRQIRRLGAAAQRCKASPSAVVGTALSEWCDTDFPGLPISGLARSKRLARTSELTVFVQALRRLGFLEASYWLSSAYAMLADEGHRKQLAMFFTPASLTRGLLNDLAEQGVDFGAESFIDPACGGAAFLAPIALRMRDALRSKNMGPRATLQHIESHLFGTDLDATLCALSAHFLRMALHAEIRATAYFPDFKVHQANSLRDLETMNGQLGVCVCNPPYRKMGLDELKPLRKAYGDVIEAQPNLYGLFIAQCVKLLREGGRAALVTPTSFLSGQYFSALRRYLSRNCVIEHIGMVSDRLGVFIDVEQETALTVLRRTERPSAGEVWAEVSVVSASGAYQSVGQSRLPDTGEVWPIPRAVEDVPLLKVAGDSPFRLSDYGYRVRIGAFVWNRDKRPTFQCARDVRRSRCQTAVPLLWSGDISLEGPTPAQPEWSSCEARLLSQLCAKLQKRSQATALRSNCSVVGNPSTAPDAVFALDGRMSAAELKKTLLSLKKMGAPEVVLVNATRSIRRESRGWKGALARFCLQLESVFGADAPGVLVVADEPHAAFRLREELCSQNSKRVASERWQAGQEYAIVGIPCAVKNDGLLLPGAVETRVPAPREIDTEIVDATAAKVVSRLNRVANAAEGGRDAAKPVTDAMAYLNRIAAMPCGVRDVSQWLVNAEADERARLRWGWPNYYASLMAYSRTGLAGEQQATLVSSIEAASKLVANYEDATPFVRLLASGIDAAVQRHKRVVVVMASHFHKHLAERFLARYAEYQSGLSFAEFASDVTLICTPQLDEALNTIGRAKLIFAGLDEESLRLLITDDRVPSHSTLLLTQQNGQYLRAAMKPLVEHFPAFKPLKPRMESILRALAHLPEDPGLLSNTDLVMPVFRIELSHETSEASEAEKDPEAWTVVLDGGRLHRRPNHRVYVYDPASRESTERGFRPCEVRSLQPGDRLFVMSAELRDTVEGIFKEAGIPLETDKVFEAALRNYHRQVTALLERSFPKGSLTEKVRALRASILEANPKWKEDFPEEQAVRHWVNLGRAAETVFDHLRPQAPLKEAHFAAFAKALGMSDLEASANWQRVILPIRNARRQDGRHLSEIYTHMLLQPESVMVHQKIGTQTIQMLYERARESLCVVEALVPNKEEALRA